MDCFLYRTHVGRFDTTCAANGCRPLKKSQTEAEGRQERKRKEDDPQLSLPRTGPEKKNKKKTPIKMWMRR